MFFEIRNLSKDFGGVRAVDDITLSIKEGMIVGLIGPNGSGKSTLFNLVTGFERPDKGTTIFRDRDISKYKCHSITKSGLVRTFQIPRPFFGLSVFENVKIACLVDLKHGEDLNLKAIRIIEELGLSRKKDERSNNLTIGELKTLEVARAVATNPALILLDEPLGGLAGEKLESMINLIRDLKHKRGITVLIIEHNIRKLMRLVDAVIVLEQGHIIAQGAPEDIVKNRRVIEAYLGRTYA
jgi:branched-chain amino acid transport system ATP-binding protein